MRLDDKFNYGVMKGKGNYFCIDRLNKCESLEFDEKGNLFLFFFRRFCEDGKYGDIENISYWV